MLNSETALLKSNHTKDTRAAIFAASSGNLVEWFDFYIYAFCAVYFAPIFFHVSDPTIQLLNAAGVFAGGFLTRPLGSWVIGRIADKHGRKKALIFSTLLMCGSSLVIACLPGYLVIGFFSPVLLLIARLIQGFSIGGEYGTVATYMSETATKNKRGFYSSFQYVTIIGGQLLAVATVTILQYLLSENDLKSWGWRIPFVIGAFAAVIVFFLRSTLTETVQTKEKGAGNLKVLFFEHKSAFFAVFGYTAGGSLCFYTFTTYMQKYLINSVHIPAKTVSVIMAICLSFFMLMQPFFGALSDRIGRRNNLLLFSVLGSIFVIPILNALRYETRPFFIILLISTALAIISCYTAVAGIVKAEMFPIKIRALGVGVPYALANAIFGGSAEYIALKFKLNGCEHIFYWYISFMLVIVFCISFWLLPKKPPYLSQDDSR